MKNQEVIITQAKSDKLRKDLGRIIKHKAATTVSERYVPVNTLEVVDDLLGKGFLITDVSGGYSKRITNPQGKHRVDLINPDIVIGDKKDPTFGRVVLVNGYNARVALKVIAGLFRGACENGLIIGQVGDVSKIVKKHLEGIQEGLDDVQTYIRKLPQMSKLISAYQDMSVDDQMIGQLALEMALTRQQVIWGPQFDASGFEVDVESMTEVWRKEDTKKDAWTTFNLLQEKVIRGGYDYKMPEGNTRQAKPIVNPYTQDNINARLFTKFNEVLVA